jgi:hypothetical protein
MAFKNISSSEVAKFWEDGYLLIKNVFTPEEVEQLRKNAYAVREEYRQKGLTYKTTHADIDIISGDLLSKDKLRSVILDDRVRAVASSILGNKDIIYFGDSTIQIGEGARGYHKDNANRTDPTSIDWQGNYPLIRFGIYLQDHKKYSGGLKLKKGSHNTISLKSGKTILVPSEVGDLVVWSLRTTHSGNVVRLKMFPNLPIHTELEKRIPKWLKVEEQKERVSMFFTFASKDEKTNAYFDFLRKQDWILKTFKSSKLDEKAWEEIKEKNLEVVKVIQEYGQ